MLNVRRVVRQIKLLYNDIDKAVDVISAVMPNPCKEGCDYCCYQYVAVCLPEAFVIVDAIRRDHELKRYFRFNLPTLERQVEILREPDMSNIKWFDRQIPCVFLQDHRCMIYSNRPLVCRTQLVVEESAEGCKPHEKAPAIKIVGKAVFIRRMVDKAMQIGSETGISWGYRPLPLALLDAWDILEHGKEPEGRNQEAELAEMMKWAQLELGSDLLSREKGDLR